MAFEVPGLRYPALSLRWPGTLVATDVSIDIAPRSLAAPPSIAGDAQVIASDAGIWKATFGDISVSNRDQVLAFRAIANLLEGRLNPILIPVCRAWQPVPDGAVEGGLYDEVPYSDGALHSDGAGYDGTGTVIHVTAATGAAARATSLTIAIAYAGTIEPGQHFSSQGRLYRISTVTYSGTGSATITFRPPLRQSILAGDRLEFDNPTCLMRLLTDAEMDLPLHLHRWGSPTVNFVEYTV